MFDGTEPRKVLRPRLLWHPKHPSPNRGRRGKSLLDAPGRTIAPPRESLRCPFGGLFRMTQIARVRDLVATRHRGGYESERMAANVIVNKRLLGLTHVA